MLDCEFASGPCAPNPIRDEYASVRPPPGAFLCLPTDTADETCSFGAQIHVSVISTAGLLPRLITMRLIPQVSR